MNWVTLIGRLGMVILMTGLALGLISVIPSVTTTYSTTGGMMYVQPEKYDFFYLFGRLTPQLGAKISIKSNSSVDVYLLNVDVGDFQNWTMTWVAKQFPNLAGPDIWLESRNMTALNAFFQSHPDSVLWKNESSTSVSEEFYPSTDTNATGIIANPSLNAVQYTNEIGQVTSLAPKAKVVLLAEALIPAGFVLAIPWAYSTRKRKPQLQ
jgi:hypothetical protein